MEVKFQFQHNFALVFFFRSSFFFSMKVSKTKRGFYFDDAEVCALFSWGLAVAVAKSGGSKSTAVGSIMFGWRWLCGVGRTVEHSHKLCHRCAPH